MKILLILLPIIFFASFAQAQTGTLEFQLNTPVVANLQGYQFKVQRVDVASAPVEYLIMDPAITSYSIPNLAVGTYEVSAEYWADGTTCGYDLPVTLQVLDESAPVLALLVFSVASSGYTPLDPVTECQNNPACVMP